MELTLKEYANSLNLSYEAVRSSFKVHEGKELVEGIHFWKSGRSKILTDEGIAVMNEYRKQYKKQSMIVYPGDVAKLEEQIKEQLEQIRKLEENISALEAEKADLNLQIADLKNMLNDRNNSLIDALLKLQEANTKLLTVAEEPKKGFFARIFRRK